MTWRLAGTLPQPPPACSFLHQDRQLDRTRYGPQWLKDPRIADIVRQAILYGEQSRHAYDLYAWAIMPNHVHIVLQPHQRLQEIVRWLKGATANRANEILGRTGQRFWQREYYDHWIRDRQELESTISYVEANPLDAGLVEWPWSSAGDKIAGVTG